MDIKQHFEKAKKKLEGIDWKKLIGTKAFITVGCVMLICAAVLVSTLVGTSPDTPTDEGNRVLGNTLLADSSSAEENDAGADVESGENINASPETAEDFFAMAIINRTQVRDSALEVLREIAESPDTLPDAKEDALTSIADIADDMSAEANIETLVKAKGFEDCVAVISDDSVSVIVRSDELLASEAAQIFSIVYDTTGISPEKISIISK